MVSRGVKKKKKNPCNGSEKCEECNKVQKGWSLIWISIPLSGKTNETWRGGSIHKGRITTKP